jgi:uncharacterized membrane protein YphA (DoxX/SURF4 family)
MNVVLWILQGLDAAVFLGSGALKVSRPKDELAKNLAWVTHFSPAMVKFIGAVEVLGALGLILPAATRIAPILTPIAAIGLGLTMIGALVTHARLGDKANLFVPSAVLLIISAVVAWGRFGPYHF